MHIAIHRDGVGRTKCGTLHWMSENANVVVGAWRGCVAHKHVECRNGRPGSFCDRSRVQAGTLCSPLPADLHISVPSKSRLLRTSGLPPRCEVLYNVVRIGGVFCAFNWLSMIATPPYNVFKISDGARGLVTPFEVHKTKSHTHTCCYPSGCDPPTLLQ